MTEGEIPGKRFQVRNSGVFEISEFELARSNCTPTENRDQIFLIDIFLQIMACKLTNLSDFTPDKNLSCSEAGRRRL